MRTKLFLCSCMVFLLPQLLPAENIDIPPPLLSTATPQGLSFSTATPQGALTLEACYRKALSTDNELAFREQVIRETKGTYLSALGTILPQASFESSYTRNFFRPGVVLPSYFAAPESYLGRFVWSQVILQGLKEYAALSAGSQTLRQRRLEKVRSAQTLFGNVSDAFFQVLEARGTLDILAGIRIILEQRVRDLNERVGVGRSRRSETVSIEVALHQNEAQTELARGREAIAVERLKYYTGFGEIGPLSFIETSSGPVTAADRYSIRAENRSDVVAARYAYWTAQQGIISAQSGFWPYVTLSGDYYTRQEGRDTGIDWDVMLAMTLPLLPQVQTIGNVRAAKARSQQARLALDSTRNSALLDVKSAYNDYTAAVRREEAFKTALDSAEENFRLQAGDYRLNLVSNLDVLTAIQTLQGARSDYLVAHFETQRLYRRLLVASGESL